MIHQTKKCKVDEGPRTGGARKGEHYADVLSVWFITDFVDRFDTIISSMW